MFAKVKVTLLVSALIIYFPVKARADANGGTTCAGCAILLGLSDHLAQIHSTDIVTAIDNFLCAKIPSPLSEACRRILDEFGPILIDQIYHNQTPDMICHNIGLCKQDPGKDFCHIFPLPESNHTSPFKGPLLSARPIAGKGIEDFQICNLPGIKDICEAIDGFADGHLPLEDKDKDRFSTFPTFRGTHWRGKDCDDSRKDVYPGRKPINSDIKFDSNCNGIYGVDPDSGRPFEDLYCSETSPKGIAILGDSAGAHFHIPPDYFIAENFNDKTFGDMLTVLSNEFDWPQLSSVTAFGPNEWPNSINGPIDSLYLRMLNQNKCGHRDYQNIAVNGGSSGNMHEIMKGLARNRTIDNPMIIVLALIGNDVCNGHVDTVDRMTKPAEYRSNMLTTLDYLNTTLPKGSSIIISGLADGRVLWDTLSTRIHPLGKLNSDVTYEDLYTYLNCLEVSPCRGWMSSNATLRDLTSQRSAELSKIAEEITKTKSYKNFDLIYADFDIKRMFEEWESRGGEDWEVIEPVDGFHPSQVGQYLSAQFIYELLSTNHTHVLGNKNPYNQKISQVFGNQGGY